jgi:uncharacterized protein (TIGR02145 family)
LKKLQFLILVLAVLQIGFVSAQKVSNVNYRQEQSTINVSYDLETKTTCNISLYVSINAGNTWQGPLIKLMGDVGAKIISGNHSITWNVLEEFEELRGDKIMFQVRAADNAIETLKIGSQEWTTKNLDVSWFRNGDVIPEVKDAIQWASLKTGAWCYYNNDPKNGAIYGKLYNWYAVNDPRGLAPEGYHVPSDNEWDTLIDYLGGITYGGGKIKTRGSTLWNTPNKGATNETGFTAIPGGYREDNGISSNIGNWGNWWSSSQNRTMTAWNRSLYYGNSDVNRYGYYKTYGFSVRLLKN